MHKKIEESNKNIRKQMCLLIVDKKKLVSNEMKLNLSTILQSTHNIVF